MADTEDGANSQRPLLGVIMCCTSIPPERRSDLAAVASQMGAVNKLDLTSDVTHLIVGDTDTPKYKYVAKERPDVQCVLPEWVEAVRDSWMEGGATDVQALEKRFRLPTLYRLRICVTGFEDLIVRKQIEEAVKIQGGEYRGDLTKEVSHLIALKPAGNKHNFARLWGVKVVSIEWLQQSLERGMILDETLFDPLLDESQRGRDAWIRRTTSSASLNKRPRDDDTEVAPIRKLRRTASAKFSSQNEGIWGDIMGGGFGPSDDTKDPWAEQQRDSENPIKSVAQSAKVEIANSIPRDTAPEQPFSMTLRTTNGQGIFHNTQFVLHGFMDKETAILEKHLQSHGAQISIGLGGIKDDSSLSSDDRFLIVPHNTLKTNVPSIPEHASIYTVATNLWVEQCLSKKRFLPPTQSLMNQPFHFPLSGFENLVLTSTAFENIDLLHVSKVIKLLGATYDECLTPKINALICNDTSSTRDKLKHAWAWDIPAVQADWLWECMRADKRLPFERYLIHPPRPPSNGEKPKRASDDLKREAPFEEQPPPKKRLFNRTANGLLVKQDALPSRKGTPDTAKETPKKPPTEELPGEGSTESEDVNDMNNDAPPPTAHTRTSSVRSSSSNVNTDSSHAMPPTSSHTSLPTNSHPLHEVSPNTSPKRSPAKHDSTKASSQHQFLPKSSISTTANVISNHLAALRRPSIPKNSSDPAIDNSRPTSSSGRPGRPTKRKLFGRATSNLSAKSAGSAEFSRAGSVDTMNSEGMGTPLEASLSLDTNGKTSDTSFATNGGKESKSSAVADFLKSLNEGGEGKKEEERLATQVVYEEPEAKAWRDRIVGRLRGQKGKVEEEGRKVEEVRGGVMDETVGGAGRKTRRGGR